KNSRSKARCSPQSSLSQMMHISPSSQRVLHRGIFDSALNIAPRPSSTLSKTRGDPLHCGTRSKTEKAMLLRNLATAANQRTETAQHGIRIRSLLTDNGNCYRSRQFHRLCAQLGISPLVQRLDK